MRNPTVPSLAFQPIKSPEPAAMLLNCRQFGAQHLARKVTQLLLWLTQEIQVPLARGLSPNQRNLTDQLLQKKIIRECNSTNNSSISPVLKPKGTWYLIINFSPLKKQIPLFHLPIILLDQVLARVKGACFNSSVDVANRFWTMNVNPADQYKLSYLEPLPFKLFLYQAFCDAAAYGWHGVI